MQLYLPGAGPEPTMAGRVEQPDQQLRLPGLYVPGHAERRLHHDHGTGTVNPLYCVRPHTTISLILIPSIIFFLI